MLNRLLRALYLYPSTPSRPAAGTAPLEQLPTEVLDQMVHKLPLHDLARLGATSRRMREVCTRDSLWELATQPWTSLQPPLTDTPGNTLHGLYSMRANRARRALAGESFQRMVLEFPGRSHVFPRAGLLAQATCSSSSMRCSIKVQALRPRAPSIERWCALPEDLSGRFMSANVAESWGDDFVLVDRNSDKATLVAGRTFEQHIELSANDGVPIVFVSSLNHDLLALVNASRRVLAYRKDGTCAQDMQLDEVCTWSKIQRGRDGHLVFNDPVGKRVTIVDVVAGNFYRLDLRDVTSVRDAVLQLRAFFRTHGYASHESDVHISRMQHGNYGAAGALAFVRGNVVGVYSVNVNRGVKCNLDKTVQLYHLDDATNTLRFEHPVSARNMFRCLHVGERYLVVRFYPRSFLCIDGDTGAHHLMELANDLSEQPSGVAAIDHKTVAVCNQDVLFIGLGSWPPQFLGRAHDRDYRPTRVTDAGGFRLVTNDGRSTHAQLWDLTEAGDKMPITCVLQ